MSIDFAKLQGLTSPEGVVTHIAIGEAVVWQPVVASGTYGDNITWALSPKGALTFGGTGEIVGVATDSNVPWEAYKAEITSVVIKDGVTSIGAQAFEYYPIQSVTIPASVASMGKNAFRMCENLTEVEIAYGVPSIGQGAFACCYSLKSVNIPNSVTEIMNGAFMSCIALESVTLPEGLTQINPTTFQNCNALASITIPASVTSIGGAAFQLMSTEYQRTVTMLSPTPPVLSTGNVFNTVGSNYIVVPAGSGDAYKNATYWSAWADYITEAI